MDGETKRYRFFQNRQCEYFPCHAVDDPDRFNCLFCYCPLYHRADCGGDYVNQNGVKDCTPCLYPHDPDNYDEICARLGEKE